MPLASGLMQPREDSPSEETTQMLLTTAAKCSQLEAVRSLLRQHPSVMLNEEIVRGAVNTGSIPIFKALLAKDPSIINMQFDMRGTPLIVACMGQQSIEYLRFLLEAGADPNQYPDAAAFPLALVAALYKDPAAIDLLLQNGAHLQHSGSLAAAARRGNEPMMLHLLERGARPETDASSAGADASPLHVAVKCGHHGAAKILRQYGADLHAADSTGTAATEFAEQMRRDGNDVSEMLQALKGE